MSQTAQRVLKRRKSLERKVLDAFRGTFRHISVSKLVASLNAEFHRDGIRFRQKKEKTLGAQVCVSGLCEVCPFTGKQEIEITLHYRDTTIELDYYNPQLPIDITCAVIHELVHKAQVQARPKGLGFVKTFTDAEYFELPDEIDAYAAEIAYILHMAQQPMNHKCYLLGYKHLTLARGSKEFRKFYKKLYQNLIWLQGKNK